jgi:two-component system response regulator ResD
MKSILVAEDELHILLLIQRKLESVGYAVQSTSDGNDALKLALQGNYDLLLLDVMLPGREGLDVCREVKAALGDKAPPVILMSARGQQIDVQAGQDAGADDYIIKPFSPRQLLELVEEALG